MTVYCLRQLVKLFRINALVNKDKYDKCIIFECWIKKDKMLSIEFYSLWNLDYFILYRKNIVEKEFYKYTEIELPWLYIYYS